MYKQQAKGATECRKIGDCTEGETEEERPNYQQKRDIYLFCNRSNIDCGHKIKHYNIQYVFSNGSFSYFREYSELILTLFRKIVEMHLI